MHFTFDEYDHFEWYLELGPLSNVNEKYFHGEVATWNDFVNHPNYDEFWQRAGGYAVVSRTASRCRI